MTASKSVILVLALSLSAAVLLLPPIFLGAGTAGLLCIITAFLVPRVGLLLWLLTTPVISFWVVISLGAGVPDVTYDRVMVATLVAVVVLRILLGISSSPRFGQMEAAMLIFIALAGLTLLKSGQFTRDLQLLLDSYIVPYLVYWVSRSLFADSDSPRWLIVILVMLGLQLVGLGFVQMLTGHVPLLPESFRPIHVGRMTGPFINAAEFGGVLAIISCVCFAFAATARSQLRRWALVGLLAVFCIGAAFSMTRAVWLCTATGLFIVAWQHPLARKLLIITIASMVVLGGLCGPFLLEANLLQERTGEIEPIWNRIIATSTALRMWLHKPFFGYGFGRYVFAEHSREFLAPIGSISADWGAAVYVPHNEFLHLLVLTGIVGLACHVVIFGGAIRAAAKWRLLPQGFPQALALGMAGAIAAYILNGLFADLIFFEFHSLLFFLLLGTLRGTIDASHLNGEASE